MAWLENVYYIITDYPIPYQNRLSYTVSEPIILYRIKKRFLRALEEKQPQEKEQQADA